MTGGWQQLCLVVDARQLPLAEALLELAGAQAIGLADAGARDLLEPAPGTTPVWPSVELRALFPDTAGLRALRKALSGVLATGTDVEIVPLGNNAWEHALRDAPEETLIGRRLALGGPRAAPVPGRCLLRLNFGLAFGTGRHPTTRLCLEWIERWTRPGERVLDYGCGSGILALAALALGAAAAWAVDIEPQALDATLSNAQLNDCAARLWVGPPDTLPPVVVDTLVANILAAPLIALAPRFADLVRADGRLVVSGLLSAQRSDVEAALRSDFEQFAVSERDGWACLSATRRR